MQWQTKTRVHYLILISWVLPTLFFAIMILAWEAMTRSLLRSIKLEVKVS